MLWRVKISAAVLALAAVAPAFASDVTDSRVALRRSREEMAGKPVMLTTRATQVQPAAPVVYREVQNETVRVAPPQPAAEMPAFVGVGNTRVDRDQATPARQAVYETLSTRGPRTAAAVSETSVQQVQPVGSQQVEPAQRATLASHTRVSVGFGYSSGGGSSIGVGVGYSSGHHGGTSVGVAVNSGYYGGGYYGGGYYGGHYGYGGYGYGCGYAPAYYYRPTYCAPPVYYPSSCYSYYPRYYGYSSWCGPGYGFSFGFRGRF